MHAALRNNAQVFFQAWTFLAIAVLIIVWPIPHTIAARNIAIYSGLAAALAWFFLARPKLSIVDLWPVLCLLAVPAWVLLHWFFISNLQELQWQELSSTWLRAVILVVLGATSGIMVTKNPRLILGIALPITVLPLISLVVNIEKSIAHDTFIFNEQLYGIYNAKFLEVYFVLLQVLIGFAMMHFAILNAHIKKAIIVFSIGFFFVFTGAINFIYAHALNGVLMIIAGTLAFILLFFLNYKIFICSLNKNNKRIFLFIIFALTSLSLLLLISNYSFIDNISGWKLKNLISDIQVSVSKFRHDQSWTAYESISVYPADADGRHINGSTYERVSWFLKGIEYIAKYPMGIGISHQAFGHYMRAEFPGSLALMTHSAWIDFTLGLGLPLLVLMWLIIFGIVYRGYLKIKSSEVKNSIHDQLSHFPCALLIALLSIWNTLGIFIFWIIGEVSERIFIENYFFFLAFFSMAIGKSKFLNR